MLRALLDEDAPHGDLTTESLPLAGLGSVRFTARADMTLSGVEEAARLFELAGAAADVMRPSGARVATGSLLLQARGRPDALLLAWKAAQTLVESMSGIAGGVRHILDALDAASCTVPVACTRKNFPGTRVFAARAVKDGGGVMHRLGLSESLLVFPEHLLFVAPQQGQQALTELRRRQPEKRLVVEVGSEAEALAAAAAGADVLQLERFAPEALAALRATLQQHGLQVKLAPAGGVNATNAVAYARASADLLVSSAPYWAPPADVKVAFMRSDGA
ncbi:ModD protein [uncultured Azohydromonas sp.]|uniref:ModD protein n=1 Tax=uncultured Azohydromonas sp. TaxID=487342 RepID=UPI00262E4B45|nr:ModD protein [uncultured Azohydromonas sp.]